MEQSKRRILLFVLAAILPWIPLGLIWLLFALTNNQVSENGPWAALGFLALLVALAYMPGEALVAHLLHLDLRQFSKTPETGMAMGAVFYSLLLLVFVALFEFFKLR